MKRKLTAVLLALFAAAAVSKEPVTGAGAAEQKMTEDTAFHTAQPPGDAAQVLFTTGGGIVNAAVSGIGKDSNGRMYLADRNYHVLRRRAKNGRCVILAGQEGVSGYQDGDAARALFHSPWDVALYRNGWAVSDTENHAIRFYDGRKVTTIAGNGTGAYRDGKGKQALFNRPTGLAAGKNGELYIADTGNHVIRVMDKNGKVSVYAGKQKGCAQGTLKKARFNEPTGLYFYKGALYVADSGNHRICKIKNGKVTTVAGSAKGIEGDFAGSARKAGLSNPQDIFLFRDVLYIADTGNGSVKKMSGNKVTEFLPAFSLNGQKAPAEPGSLMIQNGYLFVGDLFTEEMLKVKL